MGREFAAAIGRWAAPRGPSGCSRGSTPSATPSPERARVVRARPDRRRADRRPPAPARRPRARRRLLAVPHHLHEELYLDAIAGRQGLPRREAVRDRPRRRTADRRGARRAPELFVRCSSELPYFPGAQRRLRAGSAAGALGALIEVARRVPALERPRPRKPINWKRQARFCGDYGVHGRPRHARAAPAAAARLAAATRLRRAPGHRAPSAPAPTARPCRATRRTTRRSTRDAGGFPLRIETKRIAPGESNTWRSRSLGTRRRRRVLDRKPRRRCGRFVRAGRPPGCGSAQTGSAVGVPDDHRRDLRVRLLRRDPADVGGLPRRARGRARRPARLRDARRGARRARAVRRGAGLRASGAAEPVPSA